MQSTNDLPQLTPGLTITGSAGYSLIYLRGIGTSAFIPSFDPSVATYVDGIYIPSQQATLTDLGGVERVEILKGPQGTLFGRNSTGGAINVITKSPGPEPELNVSLEMGNYAERKAKLYASVPITSTLGFSVAGIYSSMHSYYDLVSDPLSLTTPPNYSLRPDRDSGFRGKFRWRPTDSLDFIFAGYRILESGSRAFLEPNVDPSPLLGSVPGLAIHPAGDYKTNQNTPPSSNSVTTTLYGSAKWSLPGVDLKFYGGRQSQDSYALSYDFDGGQPDIVAFTAQHSPSDLKSGELQFVSNDRGWTPHWMRWVGGLYYFRQIAGYDPFTAFVGTTGLIPIPPSLNFGFGPVGLTSHGVLETHSYSEFLQTSFDFTDWVGLTVGARYQREDRYLVKQFVQAEALNSGQIDVFQWQQPKRYQHNVSPKATIDFKPIDGSLLYLTWARGYKSASYNIVTLYTPPGYVNPEINTMWEVGIKTTSVPGLTLNAAAFDNEIKDLQESVLSLQSGGAISAENAGAARSRGAEFDATWVPLMEKDPGLAITGGATYLSAKYTDYQNASGFNQQSGIYFNNGNFSGNSLSRTPRFSSTLNVTQTIDTRNGSVEMAADAYFNGGFNFAAQNGPTTRQGAYEVVNTRLSYLYLPWKVRATAFCRNLLSEKYADTSLVVDFGTYKQLAPPRTYGINLTYDYGVGR